MSLTIGKIFRLRQCATPGGRFVMLALDHRQNLKRSFNQADPNSVTYEQMVAFKQHVTEVLAPSSSGILLDPEYGAAPAIAAGIIPAGVGLLVACEETGYTGDPTARQSAILPGWSVEKIARMGAAGVKLLLYYHPDAPTAATQEALVKQIADDCRRYDIPLFLEPLSFSPDPAVKKLSSAEKRQVVVETARRLTPLGVDILKAEFPLEIDQEPSEDVWEQACRELSRASAVPWVLLSAGVNFAQFERQTAVACRAGASGVLAGRAVWKESVNLEGAARDQFLRTTGVERMSRLMHLCTQYGRDWTDFYPDLAATVVEGWYRRY